MYMSTEEMDRECPGISVAIPPQFRQTIPADVMASPMNTDVLVKGFSFLSSFVQQLFQRLQYKQGDPWPMWKLVAAFYLVENQVGASSAMKVGTQIFSTMPWPPGVKGIADALHLMDIAYHDSHGIKDRNDPRWERVGGWVITQESPGRIIIANRSPYGDGLEEGTVAGVCRAFSRQHSMSRVMPTTRRKTDGARETIYEVTWDT